MRALGVDRPTLVQFRKAEGRVHLEMACAAWHSSLTVVQSRTLERSQRLAMAAIVGHWAPSHTEQLSELGLERLSTRSPWPGQQPTGNQQSLTSLGSSMAPSYS